MSASAESRQSDDDARGAVRRSAGPQMPAGALCRTSTAVLEPPHAGCDPGPAWPRFVGTRAVLADDALAAKSAGMGEDRGPVVLKVLVELDPGHTAEQQLPQLVLAPLERERSQVDAIEFQ